MDHSHVYNEKVSNPYYFSIAACLPRRMKYYCGFAAASQKCRIWLVYAACVACKLGTCAAILEFDLEILRYPRLLENASSPLRNITKFIHFCLFNKVNVIGTTSTLPFSMVWRDESICCLFSNKYRIQDMFLDRHQVWRSHVDLDFLYCVEIYIFNFHNFYNT